MATLKTVREMSTTVIKKLDLRGAAEAEAGAWRNLLPPEPWVDHVTANPGHFANWVRTRLLSGVRNAPGHVADARKAHQATRPVAILGIAERIVYRALTDWVLKDVELPSRTPEDYEAFVAGPVTHVADGRSRFSLREAGSIYVVQADVSSFYEYIDHGVLLRELESRSGKVEESRLLIDFLGETQGTTYGLPQLLEASDRLSEVYIQILERDIVRRVGEVWRFNDDFRLVVQGYGAAQQSLEDLGAAARPLGLVLNDRKSSIFRFSTYLTKNFFSLPEGDDSEIEVAEIEQHRSDEYPGIEVDGRLSAAHEILDRLRDGTEAPIDVLNPDPDDVRKLRRAIAVLSREGSLEGLPYVEQLFRYIPQLTPRLADYMIAVTGAGHDAYGAWSSVVEKSDALNSWQRAWLVYVARRCSFFGEGSIEWLRAQSASAPPGLLHAETALALASAGEGEFSRLDAALRSQPEALSPWYLLAIDASSATSDQRAAVRGSSRLYELLVGPEAPT